MAAEDSNLANLVEYEWSEVCEEVREDKKPAVGEWFWVKAESGRKKERWLGCVRLVGSNFVELEGVASDKYAAPVARVHFDEIDKELEPASDAEQVISGKVLQHQVEVRRLMAEVKALTARLAVPVGNLSAQPEGETSALALRSPGESMDDYKTALVTARKETLPALFKKIEEANLQTANWMQAKLIPLKAQAAGLKPVIEAIENRIFNVELYAGLVEQVEQISDGDPAGTATSIHLMQRRCYMDEECLARYQHGGMEFANLRGFDAWLAKPENRDRILPHPRCVVAFQVRRNPKDREAVNLRDYFRIIKAEQLDRLTFLYIRNGDRLYRLSTEIDFGTNLFPDLERTDTTKPLYMKVGRWARFQEGDADALISEGEYEALLEWDREHAGKPRYEGSDWLHEAKATEYELFSPASVFYDDATRYLEAEMARHNRMVLVLQGLLDRSTVFHPHPPWQLWTPEGFGVALSLVHDDSRALTTGDAPDFEAYRARLNASLKTGSVTVGQMDRWLLKQGEIESARRDRDWRDKSDYRPERFRPDGDPGPGTLARVAHYQPKAKVCRYAWKRASKRDCWRDDAGATIPATFACEAKHLLNVDAYQAGDFKIFFADPRTRAEYLKWAPLLLEAEEFWAGNRPVGEEE